MGGRNGARGAVVIGVDGSEADVGALRWAADQAVLEDRPLLVAHAVGKWTSASPEVDPRLVVAALTRSGDAVVLAASKQVLAIQPRVAVHTLVQGRAPHDMLEELSREAAVLVIGSRGRGAVGSRLLGSVGLVMTHRSSCPVVVCPPSAPQAGREGILVGVDGSPGSMNAIDFAFRQSALHGEPLTAVHVVAGSTHLGSADDEGEASLRLLSEALAGTGEHYPNVRVISSLHRGSPAESLVAEGRDKRMIVLGVHMSRTVLPLLDHRTDAAVLRRAPTVVAVVPA